jgi:hypothetical protein
MQNYHIYDLNVDSDLELPADCTIKAVPAFSKSLTISHQPNAPSEFAQVQWISSRYGGLIRCYDVQDGILVCIEGDDGQPFRFQVKSSGDELIFDTFCSMAPAIIANLGLSLCKLLQGDVTLHGIAVGMENKVAGVLARSQTGKSTLLWTLLDYGAHFASDDVFPVHVQGGNVTVTPSVSLHAKLSKEGLARRDMDWTQLQPISPEADLFWLPIAQDKRVITEHTLDALFILQPTQATDKNVVNVQRIAGGAAISLLLENTHGLWAAYPTLDGSKMFSTYVHLAEAVPIYVLRYVRSYEILPHLADAIHSHI